MNSGFGPLKLVKSELFILIWKRKLFTNNLFNISYIFKFIVIIALKIGSLFL